MSRDPLSRWFYASAAHIVTTGEALKKELVGGTADAAKIESVPTGIDAQRFRPARSSPRHALGLPGNRTLVGIVATLRSWKGHRFLVEALRASERAPVIVGDGPQRGHGSARQKLG